MLMIPLPFVIALIVVFLLGRELFTDRAEGTNYWLVGFLSLLTFQEVLIGLRFGYDLNWLRLIQPFSAAVIPPLAYLSFCRPRWSSSLLVYLAPLVAVAVTIAALPGLIDAVLAANNLFFAVALIRLGLRGIDAFGWVELRRATTVLLLLWLVVAVLVVSGVTDALIVLDFWQTSGINTANIASWASAIGTLAFVFGIGVFWLFWKGSVQNSADDHAQHDTVFEKLGSMMDRERLYLDPDINLNRIARRMMMPARDVSRAINNKTGGNVSRYINALRIEEACRLLSNTQMPVTQIVFASGFNTKSNFHREFLRVKKINPSEWREKSNQ